MSDNNGNGNRLKVFIVDDSQLVHDMLKEHVKNSKCADVVCSAYDVPDALQSLEKVKADVMILDMRMPTGSGLDVLEHVKKQFPHIKVIVFTSFPSMYIEHRSKTLGADYFFDKATDMERMMSLLSDLGTEIHDKRKCIN